MIDPEEDEDREFEFVDEDEHEVDEDRMAPLSGLAGVAGWIMAILLGLFLLYWALRFFGAIGQYFSD